MADKGHEGLGRPRWLPPEGDYIDYEPWQRLTLTRVEADTKRQLASAPRRLKHTLSVAQEAEYLAFIYGQDPYLARVAGLFHDWYKVVPKADLIARAHRLGIEPGADLKLIEPLLHGMVCARELPERYPHIPGEVWHAVACHTLAAEDMSPLDMVLFVADGIEEGRKNVEGIARVRALVGTASLADLFWASFTGGITYVIETSRYLYPKTIEIYNSLALSRSAARKER